jgi:acetoacetate decarboxylase
MNERFDMPAMFGPSPMPDQSVVTGATVASISFEISQADASKLLPRFFRPTEAPTIAFTVINYPSLEYMGGRGYNELVVAVAAVWPSPDGDIRATFAPVMWVDQAGALISGREFMGFGKLLGNFDVERDANSLQWTCREYDNVLLDGGLTNLQAMSEETLNKINRHAGEVNTFGWKYIASDTDVPDADYPTINVTRWRYSRAWSGEGRLNIHNPTSVDAPLSSRVIAGLGGVTLGQSRQAFMAEGDVIIDRTATRRLGNGPGMALAQK